MLSRLCVCTVAFCVAAATATAQSPSPAPDLHIGDTWKYRILDGFTHEPQSEATHRVVDLNDKEIVVQVRNTKSDKSSLRYFNRHWNILDSGEFKYDPYYPEYKFPLSVGMTWDGKYTSSGNDGNAFSGYLKARVAALEKVTVPAGTFDAYRIESDLETRSDNANSVVTQQQTTTWYAPTVGRFVRRQVVTSRDGRVRNKIEDELIEYGSAAKSGASGQ